MYFFFGSFLILCMLFVLFGPWRSRRILQKICHMDCCQKVCLLNELASPFGYSYLPGQDIMTSQVDAWQRTFGYGSLYDRSAVHFNMVFDCEPVYFDYQGRTWLIEFWKGQYGINTGGEIGVYQADRLLSPAEYDSALFQSVPDSQMLPLSMELYSGRTHLFSASQVHWWLTGFRMGVYHEPEELTMRASITFPCPDMMESFLRGLRSAGHHSCDFCICGHTVTLSFESTGGLHDRKRWPARFSQWKNRIFCELYIRMTRPFTCTPDRILYLYYFLPFAFRRMLRIRPYKKRDVRWNRR